VASVAQGVSANRKAKKGAAQNDQAVKLNIEEQKVIDADNRESYKLELDETIRRNEEQQTQVEGMTKVGIGASGFGAGGSLGQYMEKMESQHASDIDWMKTTGVKNLETMGKEATA